MLPLAEVLTLAGKTVATLFNAESAKRKGSWQEVILVLDKLNELSTLHVKAIAEVCAPLLNKGDLIETARLHTELVNNPDFPQGYETIRGILSSAKGLPAFQKEEVKTAISAVLDSMYNLQYGVFTLAWDSYRVTDALSRAARSIQSQDSSPADFALVCKPFVSTFTNLFEDPVEQKVLDEETTAADAITFLQSWCRAWQRHVQRTLYGGTGLNHAVAQLRMLQYA